MRELNKMHPVIIGGMEGSGTRVISWVVEDLGVHMQPALFEMSFKPFDDFCKHRHIKYVRKGFKDENLETQLLCDAINEHPKCHQNPKYQWGMKSPRSLALFPWLSQRIPNAKFIHILRFPGDVNYGRKKNYVNWFSWRIDQEMDFEDRYFSTWSWLNMMVWVYCNSKCRDRYICLREEDLFYHQRTVVEWLMDFLCIRHAGPIRPIKPRKTIGRYIRDGNSIPSFAKKSLTHFGYQTGMEGEAQARPWCDYEQSQYGAVG